MSTIWLGDFRVKQLQLANVNDASTDDIYFVDNNAECSWLTNTASAQLPKLYTSKADIIIALGFNDCVYSCTWNAFNINTIIENYTTTLKNLTDIYTEANFYVCSVGPVDGDFPFAQYGSSGVIPEKTLNDKISVFNEGLKANSSVTFIDCYEFLKNTSFITRDGIRYTAETCKNLQDFIRSNIKVRTDGYTLLGRVRDTEEAAPKVTDADFIYWRHSSKTNGLNECIEPIKGSGNTLPNCVGYAWGRFYEIIGERPLLSRGNAGDWFGYTSDGYERSKTIDELPKPGAVICWSKPGEAGHVGIVEYVDYATGVIKTSESGYNEKTYDPTSDFWVTTRVYDKEKQNWRQASNDDKNIPTASWIDNYVFQGFIYPPKTVASKENLCTENSYGISREDMKPNACYIWHYFGSKGWTLNAVAGMLGNIEQESKMSPGVWENVYKDCETIDSNGVHTLTNKGKNFANGYGLTQWTPATKFFTWCNNGGTSGNANGTGKVLPYWEIDTQLMRIEAEVKASTGGWVTGLSQWIKKPEKGYDLTFNDFITSDKDAAWLAGAFAFCYERPARSTGSLAQQEALKKERGDNATYWFDYLKRLSPVTLEESVTKVASLKIDSCKAEKIDFSFFALNSESGSYTLSCDDTVIVTDDLLNLQEGINNVTINNKKILPNRRYKLRLEIKGKSELDYSKEISFKISQSYPDSIKNISLVCKDTLKDTDSLYDLSITKPDNLGYWGKNSCGYEKQLIINSKCVSTIQISGTQNIKDTFFSIEQDFGYKPKVDDTIQIGFRVWVTDDAGVKWYDDDMPKTSESICLLNKPVITCLNTIS